MPVLSAHNLILAAPYIDIGGNAFLKNLTTGEYAILEFQKRPWIGLGYKVNGDIFDSQKNIVYKLDGRWNKEITLIN